MNKFYKPSIFREKIPNYTTLLKLLPSDDVQIISKYQNRVLKPSTRTERYFDCPSSIQEPSIFQYLFFKLKQHPETQELANTFRRIQSDFIKVLIIDDKVHPELNGTVQILLNNSKTVRNIINDEIEEGYNPFTKQSRLLKLQIDFDNNFANYNATEFISEYDITDIDFSFVPNSHFSLDFFSYQTHKQTDKKFIGDTITELLATENKLVREIYTEVKFEFPDYFAQITIGE